MTIQNNHCYSCNREFALGELRNRCSGCCADYCIDCTTDPFVCSCDFWDMLQMDAPEVIWRLQYVGQLGGQITEFVLRPQLIKKLSYAVLLGSRETITLCKYYRES
jgi:hypothetical protein